MRILIFGATGGTGRELVTQAVDQGHGVTAFVRDPAKLTTHGGIRVLVGQIDDTAGVADAVDGHDAVISALGVGRALRPHGVITRDATAIVPAMEQAGVRRLVWMSAFGVGDTFSTASAVQKFAFRVPLRQLYADKAQGDRIIRESTLDWTLLYPVLMTNGPRTSQYRTGEHLPMKGMPKVSRADVAEFILRQLDDDSFRRKSVVVG